MRLQFTPQSSSHLPSQSRNEISRASAEPTLAVICNLQSALHFQIPSSLLNSTIQLAHLRLPASVRTSPPSPGRKSQPAVTRDGNQILQSSLKASPRSRESWSSTKKLPHPREVFVLITSIHRASRVPSDRSSSLEWVLDGWETTNANHRPSGLSIFLSCFLSEVSGTRSDPFI
jgi:hypothetical protein